MATKKKVVKKTVKKSKTVSISGPKAGDSVSLKVIGYGLVSWESATIDRVKGNTVWIEGRESQPIQYPEGKGEDTFGLRVDVVFDGGKEAKAYEASGV
jgi:hypothetical protein